MDDGDDTHTIEEEDVSENPTAGARSRTVGSWNRFVQWVLLDGNRLAVAGGLLAALLVSYTALQLVGFTAVQEFGALSTAFGALVSGNITLITVVLSINQLVLSRALGGIGALESNIEEVSDYRERVRKEIDREVAPEDPAQFTTPNK